MDAVPEKTSLPSITHLQFLVIDILRSTNGRTSPELQASLGELGVVQTGPKFFQLMRRLEDAGLVCSSDASFSVGGSIVTRTHYVATEQGVVAWQLTADFYRIRLKLSESIAQRNR